MSQIFTQARARHVFFSLYYAVLITPCVYILYILSICFVFPPAVVAIFFPFIFLRLIWLVLVPAVVVLPLSRFIVLKKLKGSLSAYKTVSTVIGGASPLVSWLVVYSIHPHADESPNYSKFSFADIMLYFTVFWICAMFFVNAHIAAGWFDKLMAKRELKWIAGAADLEASIQAQRI